MKIPTLAFLIYFFSFTGISIAIDAYPARGYLAPQFELKGMDGNLHKLSDYKGKVIFLNFWATWCPPCKQEMPGMENLENTLDPEKFKIIAVGTDMTGIPRLRRFIDKNKFTFTVLADPGGKIVSPLYRISGLPTTLIIGKDGIIRERLSGGMEWNNDANINYLKNTEKIIETNNFVGLIIKEVG